MRNSNCSTVQLNWRYHMTCCAGNTSNSQVCQKWISITYIEKSVPKKILVKSEKNQRKYIFHHTPKSLCHCCIHEWRASEEFSIYRNLRAIAVNINGKHRASLWYIPKIAVTPLMHAATASAELFYDLHWKSRSRRSCMQRQWAQRFS